MVDVYSNALNKTISVERFIGKIENKLAGPTIVFFGGIHGNEAAGVFALKDVFKKINPTEIKGTIYGITGNLQALRKNQRFLNSDLNRMWTQDSLDELFKKTSLNPEEEEQLELFEILRTILEENDPPFYFIDLHTTSSRSLPFITINDALINRKFSQRFPVPIVLGIEEYLNGPLLSYINTLGYVSIGFESGQHDEKQAITNSVAFIYLALEEVGILKKEDIPGFDNYFYKLKQDAQQIDDVYEVIYLHQIKNGDVFKMFDGFESFQNIKKGIDLAESNGEIVKATYSARIFMPLYQKRGQEGFFIIKKIEPFFLRLSSFLRRVKADNLLILFPGVSWQNRDKGVLQVNLNVARFLVKPLFHLFGYRQKLIDKTHLKLYNRERVSKLAMYKDLNWYKKTPSNRRGF